MKASLLELLQVELSAGAVCSEAGVPILDLGVWELGAGPQVAQHLRRQLAVGLPHPVRQ